MDQQLKKLYGNNSEQVLTCWKMQFHFAQMNCGTTRKSFGITLITVYSTWIITLLLNLISFRHHRHTHFQSLTLRVLCQIKFTAKKNYFLISGTAEKSATI